MNNLTPFNYEFISRGNAVLICLHGMFGSLSDFKFLQDHFPDHSLLFIDLPGHGQSDIFPQTSLEQTSHDLYALLQNMNYSEVHVLGYSLGGRLALTCHSLYPELFSSLILESSHPGLIEKERSERLKIDYARASRISETDFFESWYNQTLFYRYNQHPLYNEELQLKCTHDASKYRSAMTQLSLGRQAYLWDSINLDTPTTYIYGEMDSKFKRIGGLLKSSCVVQEISSAGHNCHVEQPTAFISVLKNHFKEFL